MGTLCCHQAVGQSTDLGGVCLFPAGIKLLKQPLGSSGIRKGSGLKSCPVCKDCNCISRIHASLGWALRWSQVCNTVEICPSQMPAPGSWCCLGVWDHLAEQPHSKKCEHVPLTPSRKSLKGNLWPSGTILAFSITLQTETWSILVCRHFTTPLQSFYAVLSGQNRWTDLAPRPCPDCCMLVISKH